MLSLALPILSLFLALILGLIIFLKNPKNKTNQIFSVISFSIAFWIFSVFMADISKEIEKALFWSKMAIIGPSLIPPLFLWFSLIFPIQKVRLTVKKIILMFLPTIVLFILVPTKLNIEKVTITEWGIDFVPGPLYIFLLIILVTYMGTGFYNLIRNYKKAQGIEKTQIKYLFLGALITLISGIIANLILPLFGYGAASVFGPSSSLIFIGSVGYAITRYRLMDIHIVLGRGVVYGFSLGVIIAFGFLLMFLGNQFLITVPFNIIAILVLIISVLLFQPIFRFFEKIASKYFYYTFYSYQRVLTDLGRGLTRVLDLDKLSLLIVNTLMNTMKLDRTVVLMREPGNGDYRIQKNIGFKEENGISLVKDNFLTIYLEKTQKPLVYEELSLVIRDTAEKEEKEKMEKLRVNMKRIEAALCLPLLMEEKIIGMIVLGNKVSGDPYFEQDIELLINLTNQASVAFQNAKLYQRLEDFSQNLQKKVDEQTREIKKAYEELKVLDKTKSRFISMASHQLRTPLSTIKGYISMLIEGSYGQIPEKAKEKLAGVFQSNERLIKIVNELLNISKIELGKMELTKTPTQIEDLIQSCYEEIKIEAEKKKLKLIWQRPKKPLPKIKIDSFKIRQTILNLIDNALKYTKEGEIEIKAKKTNSALQISVKDSGEGLIKEEQKNIFESFTRGEAGIAYWIEGVGLGLFVAKKYLELHQGRIWVESLGKGKGSTFYIELPIK